MPELVKSFSYHLVQMAQFIHEEAKAQHGQKIHPGSLRTVNINTDTAHTSLCHRMLSLAASSSGDTLSPGGSPVSASPCSPRLSLSAHGHLISTRYFHPCKYVTESKQLLVAPSRILGSNEDRYLTTEINLHLLILAFGSCPAGELPWDPLNHGTYCIYSIIYFIMVLWCPLPPSLVNLDGDCWFQFLKH